MKCSLIDTSDTDAALQLCSGSQWYSHWSVSASTAANRAKEFSDPGGGGDFRWHCCKIRDQCLLTAWLLEPIIQYMKCNPGDDTILDGSDSRADPEWLRVLAHRQREPDAALEAVVNRFRAAGVTPDIVESHLKDAGDRLYAAAASGRVSWAAEFGGERAVALISAEVGALASHLLTRAAGIRAASIEALLEEYSAVTVASSLGVARQKVYELAKGTVGADFMKTTPWSSK